MARRNYEEEQPAPRRRSPAQTPEERESLLISKSLNLIERQIDEGSISSTVLAIYAKESTTRSKLERDRLEGEVAVLRKKVETMEAAVDVRNLMQEALYAFKGYTGDDVPEEDDEDEFYG